MKKCLMMAILTGLYGASSQAGTCVGEYRDLVHTKKINLVLTLEMQEDEKVERRFGDLPRIEDYSREVASGKECYLLGKAMMEKGYLVVMENMSVPWGPDYMAIPTISKDIVMTHIEGEKKTRYLLNWSMRQNLNSSDQSAENN